MLKQNNMYYGQLVAIRSDIGHFQRWFQEQLTQIHAMQCELKNCT